MLCALQRCIRTRRIAPDNEPGGDVVSQVQMVPTGDDARPDTLEDRAVDDVLGTVECAVCLEQCTGKDATKTKCKHTFHTICIHLWEKRCVSRSFHCPVCRTELDITDKDADRKRKMYATQQEDDLYAELRVVRADNLQEDTNITRIIVGFRPEIVAIVMNRILNEDRIEADD